MAASFKREKVPDHRSTTESSPLRGDSSRHVLKHNDVVAFLARNYFGFRARRLEKLIFTATTGRSGTVTLANIFSTIPDCISLHEPYPAMNFDILEAANYGDFKYVSRKYRHIKSVNIRRNAVGYRYYMEANHLFIKTFVQQAFDDFGDRLSVIHLVRPAVEVAMSLYQLAHEPGTNGGKGWWFDYRAPSNRIGIADLLDTHKEFSHPFYRGLWYWFETEARISEWKKRLPSVPFITFETNWLNDSGRIFELLERLELVYDKSVIEAEPIIRANQRKHEKVRPALDVDVAEKMLGRFQEVLIEKGFVAPLANVLEQ